MLCGIVRAYKDHTTSLLSYKFQHHCHRQFHVHFPCPILKVECHVLPSADRPKIHRGWSLLGQLFNYKKCLSLPVLQQDNSIMHWTWTLKGSQVNLACFVFSTSLLLYKGNIYSVKQLCSSLFLSFPFMGKRTERFVIRQIWEILV
jgi:hypothetical protein